MNLFLILALQFFLFVLIIFMLNWQIVALTSAPWVRTPRWKTKKMFELANLKRGERVVDFGSGDGSSVIDAARDFGAIGTGIETQLGFVCISRIRARLLGVGNRTRFVRANMFTSPPPPADVVFCYLFPKMNARLEPILKNSYPTGTRVVSRTFAFPTLPLVSSEKIGAETVYLYRLP